MNVYITSDTQLKLWTLIESTGKEIGGFGYAKLEGGDIIWDNVFLVPQTVSMSEVDFGNGSGIEAAVNKAADDGVLGTEGFVWVSWHSHHTMKAFWSSTDAKCIDTYGKAGIPALLSFVGCHDHSYKCRFDMFGVEHGNIKVGQVTMDELKIANDTNDPVFWAIEQEIAANVTEQKFTQSKSQSFKVKSGVIQPPKPAPNLIGQKVDEALTIRDFMDEGLSYKDAKEMKEAVDSGAITFAEAIVALEDNGYWIGTEGADGFSEMAWGMAG